jgi:hypothetical protein
VQLVKEALHLAMILVASAALVPGTSFAQEAATPIIRSTSTLVMVPTLVLSDTGRPVMNLDASDFKLTDNRVEQKITVEKGEPQPLDVVVLMQTGGASAPHFHDYRKLAT